MAETFLDRLRVERAQLMERTNKLGDFIDTTPFHQLASLEQSDLRTQHQYMQGYLGVLTSRLNRLEQVH